nr:MAG TPA: hypothetical protein [Caudoviricetes sp.]
MTETMMRVMSGPFKRRGFNIGPVFLAENLYPKSGYRMRSQSVSSEASISSSSSRSSCSSSSGSSVSGTERNAMRVRAVPAANTAAPAINFLELRLIAGRTASLLNLNSTIFSLVSTVVSVVSVMRVSFQIEGSHIRHGFSRGKPISQVRDIGWDQWMLARACSTIVSHSSSVISSARNFAFSFSSFHTRFLRV